MKEIAKTSWKFWAFQSCQYNGRVFTFSRKAGRLEVTELLLGDKPALVSATLGAKATCVVLSAAEWLETHKLLLACCPFEQQILVMTSEERGVFAALVEVDWKKLEPDKIHVTTLTVNGSLKWAYCPYLCQVSENRALLYFKGQNNMWYCDIADTTMTIRECSTVMPTTSGFDTVPICLPDGNLLVTGSSPSSTDITLITTDGDPTFKKVGNIPGKARRGTSTVLVKDRFVVGFGGFNGERLDDLWIFDLQTRQTSQVRKEGDWRPGDLAVLLVVRRDLLYLIGGSSKLINCISLPVLARLILNKRIKKCFCQALGLLFVPLIAYARKSSQSFLQPLL